MRVEENDDGGEERREWRKKMRIEEKDENRGRGGK